MYVYRTTMFCTWFTVVYNFVCNSGHICIYIERPSFVHGLPWCTTLFVMVDTYVCCLYLRL